MGTSSVRRLAQLRAAREDLEVVAIRGNVDTRLRKLADPDQRLDAIVLARAGLQRLGREAEVGGVLDAERFVPAPGQGIIALEGREDDDDTRAAVQAITDERRLRLPARGARARAARSTPTATRRSAPTRCPPAAADCSCAPGSGCPTARSGSATSCCDRGRDLHEPEVLGRAVAERLQSVGADEMLRRAAEMARPSG